MYRFWICFLGASLLAQFTVAQKPDQASSSEIYHKLQKLNFLGTALYVAAHPDDENTRLISYLSNHVHARTGYLSLTRGDGGQNLIGTELRELLGVLRTQELLAARRVDGGEQFFSRANDFGYSKTPEETLDIWDKETVLGDVVRTIRAFRPDVIINRFDHRTSGTTHGHHTSSALLSLEAFELSGDKTAYPEQLEELKTWQPKRLFFNTSWWFYGSEEKFEAADKSNMLQLDVGTYYPELGISNNEIAAKASSQHLSQGFGRLSERGTQEEYIELLKGDYPKDDSNIFDGIDTSWSRIPGGKAIGDILYAVEKNFDFKNPQTHLPKLLEAYGILKSLEDGHWKKIKTASLTELIAQVTGLYLEASAETPSAVPGAQVQINIEAVNRSQAGVVLKSVRVSGAEASLRPDLSLKDNAKESLELSFTLPESVGYSSPYWLKEKGSLGMYEVTDKALIGKPETPPIFNAEFELEIEGKALTLEKPIVYRYAKPDEGELYQPFAILPRATAGFADKVLIFESGEVKRIPVVVTANTENVKGEARLVYTGGWKVEEPVQAFEIATQGDKKTLFFDVVPPADQSAITMSVKLMVDGKQIDRELVRITYDHIPDQTVLLPAEAKTVRLDIEKTGKRIGYIAGAGDEVPESLEQIGYDVTVIDPSQINAGLLKRFDAVVTGIRAYNVHEDIKYKHPLLLDYVKNGGTLIVQYNTSGRWRAQFENIAPYPLTLSRDRVTDENSEVEILASNHPLINFPNKITKSDFEGWVQERGLYFPNEWSEEFTPVLSMSDKGESATQGSLLVAKYGKGHYIYTGLSFFRELPAGVPGAYRLFSNMLSIGDAGTQQHDDDAKQ